jgi:RNA polymerase sigma-70 factor, ECF subfamily
MGKSRSNEEWIQALTATDSDQQAAAIQDLSELLLRAASLTFGRYLGGEAVFTQQEIEGLAEDSAQEALLAVLKHLREFRGDSQFTTWAYKFAVNISLTTARRERWKGISLDELQENDTPGGWYEEDCAQPDPEEKALRREVWDTISNAIQNELTDRQRQVIKWMVFDGVPMDVVVDRMKTNRNAIYKLLHDARSKLKSSLEASGILVDEAMDLFEANR